MRVKFLLCTEFDVDRHLSTNLLYAIKSLVRDCTNIHAHKKGCLTASCLRVCWKVSWVVIVSHYFVYGEGRRHQALGWSFYSMVTFGILSKTTHFTCTSFLQVTMQFQRVKLRLTQAPMRLNFSLWWPNPEN